MSRKRNPAGGAGRGAARSGGGTLVGIFIGLVFGALIAAGAAWYFTRANPFQDTATVPRTTSPAPAQGGAPADLPGKPGDRPVVKQDFEFYRILPQGDNVPSSATPGAVPVDDAGTRAAERLYLQVGAFENPSEADNLKARLALAGIEASAQRVQLNDGRVLHRVRLGPFARPEDMNPARARLAEAGFTATVSRDAP